MDRRPAVPDPVKRILRQEAGFGCCKCGFPIYEYHHIIPYAVEQHFRPGDMMLLCPNCHSQTTSGALSEAEQRRYKAKPHNIRRHKARGLLVVTEKPLAISLGSNQFVGEGAFLLVDSEPLLALSVSKDGRLQVSIKLYDRSDSLLGVIDKNEWATGDTLPWDLQFGWRWLRIQRKQREISLYIDARREFVSVRGTLWFKQQRFDLTEHEIHLNGGAVSPKSAETSGTNASISDLCFVGGQLVATTEPIGLAIAPNPRFSHMLLISDPDVDARVKKGLSAWANFITDKGMSSPAGSR